MSHANKESLHQIFRDLHAHRVKTMEPATLQININQRKTLVDTADPSRFVKVGDTVQPLQSAQRGRAVANRSRSTASCSTGPAS